MKKSQTLQPVKITLLAALIGITLGCGYSAKTTPAVAGTAPTITQLAPASATAGGAAFALTLNGTNFGSKAVVNWNGAAQTTTVVSGNQLTMAVPAAAIATSGTITVTVTNPAIPGTGLYGSGGTMAATSSPMNFTVN
jgi:hypothetical protein